MPRTNVVPSICYTIWRWRMTMTSQRGQTGGCARQDKPRKFLSNGHTHTQRERESMRERYLHIHRLTRKQRALSQWEHRLVNFRLCFPLSQPGSQLSSAWVSHWVHQVICRMHLPEVRTKVALKRRQEWPRYLHRGTSGKLCQFQALQGSPHFSCVTEPLSDNKQPNYEQLLTLT